MNCCPICHVCYNRHLSRCPLPLFVISLEIFVKPLITSCQICHRRKIFLCPKNRQLSTCPFLSFFLSFEYLAKPLMNVWHTHHICQNLSFVNIPLFVTSFEVLPDRGWILAQFPIFPDLPFL